MTCTTCNKKLSADDLDTDGNCYDCANADPDYNPDNTAMVKELLENSMQTLAAARGVSPSKLKSDLVAEHVYNEPEKYIKEVINQATKKKNVAESN